MNINNINIKNICFQNLIPQRTISEIFKSNIIVKQNLNYANSQLKNVQKNYTIQKGTNLLFNDKIFKYITELCIESIDFILNSNQNDIIKIQAKNITKYLNELIKAEWFVLILDLNEENIFEFSYSELNEEDLIIFEYKNYKIYIYLLFLKLKTTFDFDIPNQIKQEQEKLDQINIDNNKNINQKSEISKIDNEIEVKINNPIYNGNNIIIKEDDIKKEEKNMNHEENTQHSEDNNIKNEKILEENNENQENDLNIEEYNKKNIEEKEHLNNHLNCENKNIEIEKENKEENLIKEENNNKDVNINIINKIENEEVKNNKEEEEKNEINDIKSDINGNNNNNENEIIINNINIKEEKTDLNTKKSSNEDINNKNEEIINDSNKERNYKYDINTYNYTFRNRRQYYKNKNKLKNDIIYNDIKLDRKEKLKERNINTEENKILFIYNKPNKEDDLNPNKPIDLLEPSNLYYLRQDIRICNEEIENDKQLYNNIQKKIKRMLINTKIPIFDFDNYKIIKTIGEGTYGQLYSVINTLTKKSYAMKELIASDINYFYQCLNTLGINHHNKHPNILDIYGIYVIILEEKNFLIYALMDLAEGDWEKEIRRRKKLYKFYKEEELVLILRQLVSALSFLQKRNIAHRDIKLENILLFPNKLKEKNNYEFDKIYKIGDFGEAKNKIKYSEILNIIRGTDYYMSPELLEGVNKQKDFIKNNPHKSDVFSLGCCMMIASTLNYEIIQSIRTPKTQEELNKIIKSVLEKRYSQKFSDLITKMLINDKNKRIDFINLEKLIKRKYL